MIFFVNRKDIKDLSMYWSNCTLFILLEKDLQLPRKHEACTILKGTRCKSHRLHMRLEDISVLCNLIQPFMFTHRHFRQTQGFFTIKGKNILVGTLNPHLIHVPAPDVLFALPHKYHKALVDAAKQPSYANLR